MYLIKAYYVFDARTAKAEYSTPRGNVDQEPAEEPDWIVTIFSINTLR